MIRGFESKAKLNSSFILLLVRRSFAVFFISIFVKGSIFTDTYIGFIVRGVNKVGYPIYIL